MAEDLGNDTPEAVPVEGTDGDIDETTDDVADDVTEEDAEETKEEKLERKDKAINSQRLRTSQKERIVERLTLYRETRDILINIVGQYSDISVEIESLDDAEIKEGYLVDERKGLIVSGKTENEQNNKDLVIHELLIKEWEGIEENNNKELEAIAKEIAEIDEEIEEIIKKEEEEAEGGTS